MFDPRSRLYRPIPGEWAHQPRPVVVRLAERARSVEPRTRLPEFKRARELTLRSSKVRVEPGPYVPKLIRLIRRRYAMSTSRPRTTHDVDGKSFAVPKRERTPFGSVLRDVRSDLPTVETIRATDVHLRPEPRPRVSADAWLGARTPDGGR